jgi:hypothetical protein
MALYGLIRNIGSSISISLVILLLTRVRAHAGETAILE